MRRYLTPGQESHVRCMLTQPGKTLVGDGTPPGGIVRLADRGLVVFTQRRPDSYHAGWWWTATANVKAEAALFAGWYEFDR